MIHSYNSANKTRQRMMGSSKQCIKPRRVVSDIPGDIHSNPKEHPVQTEAERNMSRFKINRRVK